MKKRLRAVQIGMSHEHANGKILTLKRMTDTYELVGVADDRFMDTPKLPPGESVFDGVPVLNFEEAFRIPDLDVAIVEVPNLELVPAAFRCLERSLPIHLDKPAGEDLPLYKKLLDGYREKNLALQMGYMYRGNPAFQFCRKIVRENLLGSIFEISMDMNHGYGGEDYQEYLAGFSGGIMFNLGCHLIDFVCSVMGAPERVESFLQSTPDVRPEIRNNTLAVLQYPHATAVLRICSRLAYGSVDQRRMRISGTKGWIEMQPVERFDGEPLMLTLALKEPAAGYSAGINKIQFPPQTDRYEAQLAELAEIVRGEKRNPYSYDHDYLVHKVTLAASGYIGWKN